MDWWSVNDMRRTGFREDFLEELVPTSSLKGGFFKRGRIGEKGL